jgi:hypothetical protein
MLECWSETRAPPALGKFIAICFAQSKIPGFRRAISSVVERLLHTQEVAGSNPASRTICPRPSLEGKVLSNARKWPFLGMSSGMI